MNLVNYEGKSHETKHFRHRYSDILIIDLHVFFFMVELFALYRRYVLTII
jgi:hypothetical protein